MFSAIPRIFAAELRRKWNKSQNWVFHYLINMSYFFGQALFCKIETSKMISDPCMVTFTFRSMQWDKSNCLTTVTEKSSYVSSVLMACGKNGSNIYGSGNWKLNFFSEIIRKSEWLIPLLDCEDRQSNVIFGWKSCARNRSPYSATEFEPEWVEDNLHSVPIKFRKKIFLKIEICFSAST